MHVLGCVVFMTFCLKAEAKKEKEKTDTQLRKELVEARVEIGRLMVRNLLYITSSSRRI